MTHKLLSTITVLTACLSTLMSTVSYAQKPSESFYLKKDKAKISLQLRGIIKESIYEEQGGQRTCTREVEYTDYERQCQTRFERECRNEPREQCENHYERECSMENQCHNEPTRECTTEQQCHNEPTRECNTQQVCRDVMRPVCGPSGCVDQPTRECTNEQVCRDVMRPVCAPRQVCRDVMRPVCAPRQVCRDVMRPICRTTYEQVCENVPREDCRDVPVRRTRTEEYDCSGSGQRVKVGEETREDRLLNVIFKLKGDVQSLTGKDLMKVSVPNGVDLQNLNTKVEQVKSAKTHKIKVKKLSSASRASGGVQTTVDEVFEVQVTKIKK